MPISVRLSPRVEQKLAEYCASHRLTKSEAVKRALERLFEASPSASGAYASAKDFIGSDPRPGNVADSVKTLLRERFRRR
jgi:hypothetical protein